MGVSTDAILFYGYWWDDETSRPWTIGTDDDDNEEDDDWESRYARAKGCLPPKTPFPERTVKPTRDNGWSSTPKDYSEAEQTIIDEHRAYWKTKGDLVEAAPCVVETHCSASCPMPYVAIRASLTKSYRGSATEITSLAVDPSWNAALHEFCALMGIATEGKHAGWWLVSDWGE
ncbi:MAG TPA: hypothetical protein VLE97_08735 [Gaiellaceae bacterium]|nr:hypothetical protein [Gaiellaceae bacterium]